MTSDLNSWRNLSAAQRWTAVIVVILVVIQGIAVVLGVEVEGASGRYGGIGDRLLALFLNIETDRSHIVSQPLLWLARATVLGVIACVLWPMWAQIKQRRAATADAAVESAGAE